MRGERAQSLIEAAVALPVGLACAAALLDCGIIVRDRIAIAQAATRAAEAQLVGRDATAAARTALPTPLRSTLTVEVGDQRVTVRAASAARVADLLGAPVQLASTAHTAAKGGDQR